MSSSPQTYSRQDVEKILIDLIHEVRNQLNAISLEATDLTEQAGPEIDGSRLQKQIQRSAAYLKLLRDAFILPEIRTGPTDLETLLQEVRKSNSSLRLTEAYWPVETDFKEIVVEVDFTCLVRALGDLMQDVVHLADEAGGIGIFLTDIGQGYYAFQVTFTPNEIPLNPETWGQHFNTKASMEQLLRYRINQVFQQHGGGCTWSYDAPYLVINALFSSREKSS